MSPQGEMELPSLPNQSWLNELYHRCQLDPNQTAIDFAQHAFGRSFESDEAVAMGLQMFAQQILFEVDTRHHRRRPVPETATTATTTTLATPAQPLLSFATTLYSQKIPEALTTHVPIPPVRAGPGRPKKTQVAISPVRPGPGRPKKTPGPLTPGRAGPGRPKKAPVRAGPGRPKKTQSPLTPVRAGPGRPKKPRLISTTYAIRISPTKTSQATARGLTIDEATRPSGIGVVETLQLPVEKLCIDTGKVLQRFQTGEEAKQSVTQSSQSHAFYNSVVGKNKSSEPHVYKNFFWRLEGSSHRPGGCPCQYQNLLEKSAANHKTNSTNNDNNLFRTDPMRYTPVEKLCLETGRILERFDKAEEAFLATTDAKQPHFGNFKQVLEGRGSYPHHIYKGYFWRVAGSDKLPHTISSRGRQQELADGATTNGKSTPSAAEAKNHSPSYTTPTNNSKRQSPATLRRDSTRDVPVEGLCLETGNILKRFDRAEDAFLSMTDEKKPQFGNFKKVLEGRGSYPNHIFKGLFWRVAGSNKLPHTMSSKGRQQDLEDGKTASSTANSTPSITETENQSPSSASTSTTSKQQSQNLAEKGSANNCNTLQTDPMRHVPVEKLCLETGRILERFDTAEQAYVLTTVTTEGKKPNFSNFKMVLEGRGHYRHHIYKGCFWRVAGSNKLPHTISSRGRQQEMVDGTARKEKSTPSSASTHNHNPSSASTTTASKRQSDETFQSGSLRDVPVEGLCLETGRILERFDKAEDAYLATTDATKPQFSTFKQVLEGRGPYPHHIYKGLFWRVAGSNKLPHTVSSKGRQQEMADGTARKEKSTPSAAGTNNHNPRNASTTASKLQHHQALLSGSLHNVPVEGLCLATGRILERYDTALDAFQAKTDAKKPQFGTFKQVLLGRGSFPHHVYKGLFWRVAGSNKLPHTMSSSGRKKDSAGDTTRKEKSTPSFAATNKHNSSSASTTPTSKRQYDEKVQSGSMRNVPVEGLCLETGRILERFDKAEDAYLATTDAKNPQFSTFKQVLEGRGYYPHHIYKGLFWRVAGSSKLPHTISSTGMQDLDGTTITEQSAAKKKRSPIEETTATSSKRLKTNSTATATTTLPTPARR